MTWNEVAQIKRNYRPFFSRLIMMTPVLPAERRRRRPRGVEVEPQPTLKTWPLPSFSSYQAVLSRDQNRPEGGAERSREEPLKFHLELMEHAVLGSWALEKGRIKTGFVSPTGEIGRHGYGGAMVTAAPWLRRRSRRTEGHSDSAKNHDMILSCIFGHFQLCEEDPAHNNQRLPWAKVT